MQEMNGEPASVLNQSIRELLADVQAARVRKLDQLRTRLQVEIFAWDNTRLAQALQALYSGGRELHFAELRTSWLARTLGRHRPAFHRFAAAVDRMDACAAAVKEQARTLSEASKDHQQSARRVFVELEVESRDLAADVDRGVTWLQRMCEDINQRRGEGAGDPRLGTLAEAAQLYTQAFKDLQAIGAMVRDIAVRGQAILERRAALLEHVRMDVDAFDKQWNSRVGETAASVRAGHTSLPGLPGAVEAHDDAMKRLEAALDACGALQGEEHFMAQQLEGLRETLGQALGHSPG